MADNQIKVGFGQLFKATPDEVKKTLTISSIVIGGVIAGISASNLIPMVAKVELNGWLGAILTILHSLGAFFGVDIKSPVVPTEKVTAVKD